MARGQGSRWHLHTQCALFYLGRAPGDYKGHLLWEVPGQLQEVDPEERCPGREPPVSTEDEQSLEAALVAGQKALRGEGYKVSEVTGAQQGKRRLGSLGNGKLMGNHQIRAIPRDGKVIGISGHGAAWSQGGHGGQQRALGYGLRPHLLTLGPADHEGLTLAALGWAP